MASLYVPLLQLFLLIRSFSSTFFLYSIVLIASHYGTFFIFSLRKVYYFFFPPSDLAWKKHHVLQWTLYWSSRNDGPFLWQYFHNYCDISHFLLLLVCVSKQPIQLGLFMVIYSQLLRYLSQSSTSRSFKKTTNSTGSFYGNIFTAVATSVTFFYFSLFKKATKSQFRIN